MKVVAKERGFYDRLRERGEVFDFDMARAERAQKRDADGRLVYNEDGTPVFDPDSDAILPTWVEEASDEAVSKYAEVPQNHPTLDEQGRPYPYSVPFMQPGVRVQMDEVAAAVNDVADAQAEREAADQQLLADAVAEDKAKRDEEAEKQRMEAEGNFGVAREQDQAKVAKREQVVPQELGVAEPGPQSVSPEEQATPAKPAPEKGK